LQKSGDNFNNQNIYGKTRAKFEHLNPKFTAYSAGINWKALKTARQKFVPACFAALSHSFQKAPASRQSCQGCLKATLHYKGQ
jgi:hypothetical protein